MVLVIGATGFLGGTVVEELCRQGKPVRCIVRKGSDISKLQRQGVELIYGDIHDHSTLKKAVEEINTVISTFATRILEDRKVASLWNTDYEVNLALIRLAKEAGIRKHIFISYWGLAKFGGFEHGRIKKLVEDLLTVSGIDYTVFRVTTLATDMAILLGNRLKKKGWAPMLMKKHERVRPILLEDLAGCIVNAIDNPKASFKIIEVAGEEEYTFVELQNLFSRFIGRKVRFIFIPSSLARFVASFADFITDNKYNIKGMVSAFTGGSTCDIKMMKEIFEEKQGSFAKYLEAYIA